MIAIICSTYMLLCARQYSNVLLRLYIFYMLAKLLLLSWVNWENIWPSHLNHRDVWLCINLMVFHWIWQYTIGIALLPSIKQTSYILDTYTTLIYYLLIGLFWRITKIQKSLLLFFPPQNTLHILRKAF